MAENEQAEIVALVETRIRQLVEDYLPLRVGREEWRVFLGELERLREESRGARIDADVLREERDRQAALIEEARRAAERHRPSEASGFFFQSIADIRAALARYDEKGAKS